MGILIKAPARRREGAPPVNVLAETGETAEALHIREVVRITGLRREQSQTRANIGIVEVYQFDEASGRDIVKLNPMANWRRDAVWKYSRDHGIPYNPLHDQGYRSIGCWPCTSRAGDGDGERAGRWIGFNKVECGIHTFMPKKS